MTLFRIAVTVPRAASVTARVVEMTVAAQDLTGTMTATEEAGLISNMNFVMAVLMFLFFICVIGFRIRGLKCLYPFSF